MKPIFEKHVKLSSLGVLSFFFSKKKTKHMFCRHYSLEALSLFSLNATLKAETCTGYSLNISLDSIESKLTYWWFYLFIWESKPLVIYHNTCLEQSSSSTETHQNYTTECFIFQTAFIFENTQTKVLIFVVKLLFKDFIDCSFWATDN